jgi:hypothetical protein
VWVEILTGELNRGIKHKVDEDAGKEMWWSKMKKLGSN